MFIRNASIVVLSVAIAPCVFAADSGSPARAELRAEQSASETEAALKSYKVDVVISRYQAEKRISSLPFTLVVGGGQSGSQALSTLRLGMEVPSGMTRTISNTGEGRTVTEDITTYVGTSIDCLFTTLDDGFYRVTLTLNHSVLVPMPRAPGMTGQSVSSPIVTQTFNLRNQFRAKEGQTVPFSVGVDQFSGETLRAEVTVTTLK